MTSTRLQIPWPKLEDGDIVWDHSNDISTGEDGVNLRDLIAVHVQVLFHTRYVGIVYVTTIQIIAKVRKTAKRENKPVNLVQESLFLLRGGDLAPKCNICFVEESHLSLTAGREYPGVRSGCCFFSETADY